MTEAFRFALLGLGAGGLYALAAIGLVLVYRGSGVVNFSQAAMGMVGAYAFYEVRTHHHLPTFLAVIAGLVASAAIGALFHVLMLRRMRDASNLSKIIASLALLIVLQSIAVLIYGTQPKLVDSMLPTKPVKILGASVGADRVWIFVLVIVLTAVLWAVYKFTTFGVATSAVAENPRAAAALAVSPNVIAAANWAVGGALGALAAELLVPITGLNANNLTFLIIPVLAAAVIGGFKSFPITTAAGLVIGIAQSEVTRYVTQQGWGTAVPFVFVAIVLLLRGRAVAGKDERFGRMPKLGTGRLAPAFIAIGFIGVELCAFWLFPIKWVDALVIQLITAIILMSFVVVTGFAGQLSLAQLGFGGIGALMAAFLAARHGWPLPAAMLAGVICVIPVGVLVGLAGVRTRGVNLAIITLGFGIAVDSVVLQNVKYNGGSTFYQNPDPKFFGIRVNSIDYPARYATLSVIFLVLIGVGLANLRRGRVGRRLIAVRTNERAASALGVSVVGAKLYAFVLGAMIAAVGGVLLVFRLPSARFGDFSGLGSVLMMQNAVLGGVGAINGPLVASGMQPGTVGQQIFSFLGGKVAIYLAIASSIGLFALLAHSPDGISELQRKQNEKWLTKLRTRFRYRKPVELMGDELVMTTVPAKQLVLDHVTVRFGGTVALNDVSLVVNPGEVVGLIGPNGAGKSTAIDAITGFNTPASGTVSLDGSDLSKWTRERRARFGVSRSFQSLELFDDLTVLENILAACDDRDLAGYVTTLFTPGRPRLSAAAHAAVVDFSLGDVLDLPVNQLSYAQRRLLAVARAVAGGHSILLLDEPASGLDEAQTRQLGDLIRRLARERGIGILLVEHSVDMVLRTCDRVYALNFGSLIGEGTPAEIRTNPAVVDAYLGTSRFKDTEQTA